MGQAVVIYDLKARDGRSVVEARFAIDAGNDKIYISPKATFYSCAYDTQLGRIAAFNRVSAVCAELGCKIITYYCGQRRRAYWQ